MKRTMALGLTLVAALTLAACGGGEEGGEAAGGGDATSASTVSMVDNAYEPAALTVDAGASLEITNDGEAPHTFTVEGADINEDLESGATSAVTVNLEPGEYTVFCEYHRSAGMEGTLTVQ